MSGSRVPRVALRLAGVAVAVVAAVSWTDELGQAMVFGVGIAIVLPIEVLVGWTLPPS